MVEGDTLEDWAKVIEVRKCYTCREVIEGERFIIMNFGSQPPFCKKACAIAYLERQRDLHHEGIRIIDDTLKEMCK